MRGVVAAGNSHTAAAAARILDGGGNAVDAAVAGALACFCAEPLLTSAGGAGIMLVHRPNQVPIAVDFFSAFPGANGRPEQVDFHGIEVDFGSARQVFHIGRGAAAVPLVLEGLATAAQQFGTRTLAELTAPAIELASDGVELDALTARTFELLAPILAHDPECREELTEGLPRDRPPRAGDRLFNRRLAATLEAYAALGHTPPSLRDGLLAEFGLAQGGLISPADFESARVIVAAPHNFVIGDWMVSSSPRLGGRLVGMISEALTAGAGSSSDPANELRRRALASRSAHRARTGLPPDTRGSTTHVSVVDAAGGAASVTLTAGEGCGHVVRGTGVHINNFLGEEDLNPVGFHRHRPGDALPTMIAPTIAVHRDGRVIALGSGGANRIRSAVAQVLHGLLCEQLPLDRAVLAARVHGEEDGVWVELDGSGDGDTITRALADEFPAVHGFAGVDFFFGGVHVAARDSGGDLDGFGDPRRAGVVVRV